MIKGIFEIIREHPIFSQLDEKQLSDLANKIVRQSFAPGDIIINQGEKQNNFYIIESGLVEVIKREPTSKQLHRISQLQSGQTIGFLSFIDRKPRSASVRALEPTQVLLIPGDDFRLIATKVS